MNAIRFNVLAAAAFVFAAGTAGYAGEGPAELRGFTLEDLSATRDRPLFSPLRRPPAPQPPAPVATAQPEPEPEPEPVEARMALPQASLVGIVIANGQKVALMRDPQSGKVHRLKSGEALDGWTVTVLDPLAISFDSREGSHVRRLFQKKEAPSALDVEAQTAEEQGEPAGLWR